MLVELAPARAVPRRAAPGDASIAARQRRGGHARRCPGLGRSAAPPAQRAEHLGIRFQQAADRDAAVGVVGQFGDHRIVRPVSGRGSRAAGARHFHHDALRHPGLGGRAQCARRFLFSRNEATEPPGARTQRVGRARHHRRRARPAIAGLRHGEDRRLHQCRAEVGARPEWQLHRWSRRIRQGGDRFVRSQRVVVWLRRSARGLRQARRLLPPRPVRRLGFLRSRRSRETAVAAGRGQHRRIRGSDAPRTRRQHAAVAHRGRVDRPPHAGSRRSWPLHSRRAAGRISI